MCCEDDSTPTPAPQAQESEFSKTLANIMNERQANARKFGPLEDRLISDTERFQTPQYEAEQVGKAEADVEQGNAAADAATRNQLDSMGVDPSSGAYASANRKLTLGRSLARVGAMQGARDSTRRLAFDTIAGVSGRGDAKVGQAIQAASSGGNMMNQAQQNQIAWTQGQQQQDSSAMSGLGSLAGLAAGAMMMFSSRKLKSGIRSGETEAIAAVRKMPVKKWRYLKGIGDGGAKEHTGPLAEDAAKAIHGDGLTLHLGDAIGATMGAVQNIDRRLRSLENGK